ncbi:probable inorganic phosphate transporter 1-9 [Tanacetum coccineum]
MDSIFYYGNPIITLPFPTLPYLPNSAARLAQTFMMGHRGRHPGWRFGTFWSGQPEHDSFIKWVSKVEHCQFSCEIEQNGIVHVRGETSTGGKIVTRHSRVFEMKFQQQSPPGPFTLSFSLPGPVDPRLFYPNFRSDGIFEAIVMKSEDEDAVKYWWIGRLEKNTLQAAKDMEKVMNVSLSTIREDVEMMDTPNTRAAFSNTYPFFSREFFRRHGRDLAAASINWFLIDIVFYSLNLFQYHAFQGKMTPKRDMNFMMMLASKRNSTENLFGRQVQRSPRIFSLTFTMMIMLEE